MRQAILGLLGIGLAFAAPYFWERFMAAAPEVLVRIVMLLFALGALVWILLSDPVYTRLTSPQEHGLTSTVIVAFAGAATCAAIWWFLIVSRPGVYSIAITTFARNAEYASGTLYEGIVWHPKLTELRVDLTNPSNIDYSTVSLVIRTDVPVVKLVQTGHLPNASITDLAESSRLMPELIDRVSGRRQGIPAELIASDQGYKVDCPLLRRKQGLKLLLAIGEPTGKLGFVIKHDGFTDWFRSSIDATLPAPIEAYFGDRRPAKWVQIDGTFFAAKRTQTVSMRVDTVDHVANALKDGLL